ncbi:MAG: hypothetical protein PHS86_03535 [Syntrophaceae bacterium]|nr:hypothetical protein [Syntrophaceae bacterium]
MDSEEIFVPERAAADLKERIRVFGAALKIGLAPVAVNSRAGARELVQRIVNQRCRIVLTIDPEAYYAQTNLYDIPLDPARLDAMGRPVFMCDACMEDETDRVVGSTGGYGTVLDVGGMRGGLPGFIAIGERDGGTVPFGFVQFWPEHIVDVDVVRSE